MPCLSLRVNPVYGIAAGILIQVLVVVILNRIPPNKPRQLTGIISGPIVVESTFQTKPSTGVAIFPIEAG